MIRTEKYEQKNILQEAHILDRIEQILLNKQNEKINIIDIGGGNGFLAYLASKLFDVASIVIDPHIPSITTETETILSPSTKYSRIQCAISEFVPDSTIKYIVICKHLCGSGFDDAIDWISKNKFQIMNMMMLPCCYNKIEKITNKKVCITYNQYKYTFIDPNDIMTLATASQWKNMQEKQKNTSTYECAVQIEQILNTDRITRLNDTFKSTNIKINMGYLFSDTISPKNLMIYSEQI